MSPYISSETVKSLREQRGLTQRALAQAVGVTDKAISKWETGRGLPDISLVEPLASALGVSVAELFSGNVQRNGNRAANMLRSVFYVCPICGNVVVATGEGSFSCCGATLLPQEIEQPDASHCFKVELIEDDWCVTLDHPMTKQHYISFAAYVTTDGVCLKKLYPEQMVQPRFKVTGSGMLYLYCNQHGLFGSKVPSARRFRQTTPCEQEMHKV